MSFVDSEASRVGGSGIFGLELILFGGMLLLVFCYLFFCHPFAKGAFSFW